jgi:hypothetical protein
MTKDEIWRLAKEAGSIPVHQDYQQRVLVGNDAIERFAALVAEKEREACAKVCESAEEFPQYFQTTSLPEAIRARGNK